MITLEPIATVKNSRLIATDDYWGDIVSEIEISEWLGEDSLAEIETFSHLEIIFFFHEIDEAKIERGARHPRNNSTWPKVGILAQRGKRRPNRLGLTIVKLLKREGRTLYVTGLDAINGTPVLDIKPVMREFLPQEEIKQPAWSHELMKDYWAKENS